MPPKLILAIVCAAFGVALLWSVVEEMIAIRRKHLKQLDEEIKSLRDR